MFFLNILCENAQERKIKRILENSEKKKKITYVLNFSPLYRSKEKKSRLTKMNFVASLTIVLNLREHKKNTS